MWINRVDLRGKEVDVAIGGAVPFDPDWRERGPIVRVCRNDNLHEAVAHFRGVLARIQEVPATETAGERQAAVKLARAV